MKTLLRALAVVLAVIVVAWLFGRSRPEPDPVAGPRTDQMIAVLQDSGWVVVSAEKMGELQWKVSDLELDTATLQRKIAELSRQAAIAGAQVRAVTELYATAETQLRLAGTVHERRLDSLTYAGLPGRTSDSVTWAYRDSTFTLNATYEPPATLNVHTLRAEIAAAIAVTESADGRVLFSAIPRDPRVRLHLDRATWVPPPPVQKCTVKQRGRMLALGAALDEGARIGLRITAGR